MNTQANITKFFYQNGKLVTLNVREQCSTVLRNRSQPLAVIKGADNTGHADLLVTDEKNTVFHIVNTAGDAPLSYLPYGYTSPLSSRLPLVGFNGEPLEVLTKSYPLGNGYRIYNPILMRFYAPDELSPFAAGGLNPYMYCQGDPVGKIDPSGQVPIVLKPFNSFYKGIKNLFFGRVPKSKRPQPTPQQSRKKSLTETARDQQGNSTNPLIQNIARNERRQLLEQQASDLNDFKNYDLKSVPAEIFESRLNIFNRRKDRIKDLTTKYGLEPVRRPPLNSYTDRLSPTPTARDIRHQW